MSQRIANKWLVAVSLSLLALLAIPHAHADFPKALGSLQNRDGTTMLAEVRDAWEKKDDDGLILFLSVLKQYPETWRSLLNVAQQAEFFYILGKITFQGNLQSKYRLALIPRTIEESKPSSFGAIHEQNALIKRLEPIANKGYAPAAMSLYTAYAFPVNPSSKDSEKAMAWLEKAAESGSAQGAFVLGMKYLNVDDNAYGCNDWVKNSILICPQKNEAKGWYWMQQAAMAANERNIILGDFAYEMGNLYLKGVADQEPDLEQAYLWYRSGIDKPSHISTFGFGTSEALNNKIITKLDAMHERGELKLLENLDRPWRYDQRTAFLNLEKVGKRPRLLGKKDIEFKNKPVFSLYQANGAAKLIDVYSDGRVNVAYGPLPTDMENYETIGKKEAKLISAFTKKLERLGFYNEPSANYEGFCETGCLASIYFLTLRNEKDAKSIFRYNKGANYSEISNSSLAKYLALTEHSFAHGKLDCDLLTDQKSYSDCIDFYNSLKDAYIKAQQFSLPSQTRPDF